jgi:hypothetical protein
MSLVARNRLAMQEVTSGMPLWQLAKETGSVPHSLARLWFGLGPFWLILTKSVMVGARDLLSSAVLHDNIHKPMPCLLLLLVL